MLKVVLKTMSIRVPYVQGEHEFIRVSHTSCRKQLDAHTHVFVYLLSVSVMLQLTPLFPTL